MMKAVTKGGKNGGGGDFLNRLLFYLTHRLSEKIKLATCLRPQIFYIETESRRMIVKGYSSYNKLKMQETFTATLKKEGFDETYSYLLPAGGEPLFFDGIYYGCIEYIKPHHKSFSYLTHTDRTAGLRLLERYHNVTETIEQRYKTLIQPANIVERWKERLNRFQTNLPLIKSYCNEKAANEILGWGEFAIRGMSKHQAYFTGSTQVILHGDVAHHNFLRSSAGKLYIIDFDLISVGPRALDLLQYSNRILPFINWSLQSLGGYRQISKYMEEKAFLYALAFPSDIMREWNRCIKEKTIDEPSKKSYLMELSVDQFYQRKEFFRNLTRMIK